MVNDAIAAPEPRKPFQPAPHTNGVIRFPRKAAPMVTATPRPTAGKPPRSPAGEPQVVVVIDDDPDTLDAICALLQLADRPFAIRPFTSPREAIKACQTNPVHLLITDLHMPDLNGFEAWERIHAIAPLAIGLLLTADPDERTIHEAERRGFSAFARKPCDPAALLDLIGSLTIPA